MVLIDSIQSLGEYLSDLLFVENNSDESVNLRKTIAEAHHYNRWFTANDVSQRINSIASFLDSDTFLKYYASIPITKTRQKVGLVSEENIPLEEFFTIVTILLSGNCVLYKTGQKQDKVLSYLIQLLIKSYPALENSISFVKGPLRGFDKLIVTSREPWPQNKKIVIAKHTTLEIARYQSIAIIEENVSNNNLKNLATDVFSYFGMGSGNVKKLYIPEGYQIARIFEAFEYCYTIMDHNSYANNYQYHQSVYLMNRIEHFDNGFLLLKLDKTMHAPTGVLYYEYYSNKDQLIQKIDTMNDVNFIYCSSPNRRNEKHFGDSANQLLLPSQQVINFLV